MSRIPRLDSDATSDLKETIKQVESSMGYIPNDLLTLAHWPDMVPALGNLVSVVLDGGTVDGGLKRLIGIVVSGTQGCQYCKAHASYAASISSSKHRHCLRRRSALRCDWLGMGACNLMRSPTLTWPRRGNISAIAKLSKSHPLSRFTDF